MQANCPQCGNKIVIDDAKVPDRPFKVKCPKCQTAVSLPGKGAAPAAAPPAAERTPSAASAPVAAPPPPGAPAVAASDEMRAQMMAQVRREMALAGVAAAGRALVALPDRAQAGAVTLTLTRLGYSVDTLEDAEEGARLLEQGAFSLVATARMLAPPGKGETLYQRIIRLSPDARRRIFLLLVGDDLRTGDGTQAWAGLADLVVHSRDVASMDALLRNTLSERTRLYQVYLDARRRFEEAAG